MADREPDLKAAPPDQAPAHFTAALKALREQTRAYEAALKAPAEAPSQSPETIVDRLLDDLQQRLATGQDDGLSAFLAWAERDPKVPHLLFVVAAQAAARAGDWPACLALAKQAVSRDQHDTLAQRLFSRARRALDDPAVDAAEDLSPYFCARPFEEFELRSNGDVYTCCSAWLPVPIGNFHRQSAAEIWNSPAAQEIRASILDGSFRHCSRLHCPVIVDRRLQHRDRLADPEHRAIVAERRTVLERRPIRVLMSQDRSCNLSCPSCRTRLILARKAEQDRLNELAEEVIFPLLRDARQVKVTGSGDPLASAHFRYVLRRLADGVAPGARVQLQTNGVLLTPRAWQELGLDGLVEEVWVSIDAATPTTYDIVRRGGDFARLLANLAFLGRLRQEGRFAELRLDFVVQALNFREMPAAVELARATGCNGVYFQMIRNWGTFSTEEFARHFIGSPDHPDYAEFLAVLRHPNLALPWVNLSNMRRLHDRARRANGQDDSVFGSSPPTSAASAPSSATSGSSPASHAAAASP